MGYSSWNRRDSGDWARRHVTVIQVSKCFPVLSEPHYFVGKASSFIPLKDKLIFWLGEVKCPA